MLDPKLSHLVRAGAVVHSADGSVYRCTAKVSSKEGIQFRLADMQGKPVATPKNFMPITPRMARIANWIRFVVAYNKDFSMYVNEYIKAAGFPTDPAMDWAAYLDRLSMKLGSMDEDVRDEAIHHLLIVVLAQRKVLAQFPTAIKNFKPEIQKLPLEKQVSAFLKSQFFYNLRSAREYIKSVIHQEDTDSVWEEPTKGEDETNLLDSAQFSQTHTHDRTEYDIDSERFKRDFSDYLHNKFREETAEQYLALFDAIYDEVSEGHMPKPSEIIPEWLRRVDGKPMNFKFLFSNLPKLIDKFTIVNKNWQNHLPPAIEALRLIGQKKKERDEETLEAVQASAHFAGLKLADSFPINHDIEQPSDSNENGMSFSMPAQIAETGTVDGDALGEAAESALPALLAAKQWEIPKCKGCGSDKVGTCKGCQEKYCGDCLKSHHANYPSHDRV